MGRAYGHYDCALGLVAQLGGVLVCGVRPAGGRVNVTVKHYISMCYTVSLHFNLGCKFRVIRAETSVARSALMDTYSITFRRQCWWLLCF